MEKAAEKTTATKTSTPPTTAAATVEKELQAGEHLTGYVVKFNAHRGFGFIRPKNRKKSDECFVHWSSIKTKDAYPSLKQGMDVEFDVEIKDGKKNAANVTGVGGADIKLDVTENVQIDTAIQTGKMKFFDFKKGWGFIDPDRQDLEFDGARHEEGKGIFVSRMHINTDEVPPRVPGATPVQFKLYKDAKGKLGAAEVSAIGGGKIVAPAMSRKRRVEDDTQQGQTTTQPPPDSAPKEAAPSKETPAE